MSFIKDFLMDLELLDYLASMSEDELKLADIEYIRLPYCEEGTV